MLFDNTLFTNPNVPEENRGLLHDYATFKTKFEKAENTERKAHPYWSAISGIASSFIPFGLGSFITPAANMGVQKGKAVGTAKLNAYRSRLGLQEQPDQIDSGLDLGGLGYGLGKGIQSGAGISDLGLGDKKQYDFTPSQEYMPTAPQTTGGGTQGIELPESQYWQNANGGGQSGLFSTTKDGLLQAPPTSATMRNGGKVSGGKINAPTHEMGGADLVTNDGTKTGIKVEGEERIVNEHDWLALTGLLKKGRKKQALNLLADIDKRKPVEQEMAGGGKFDWNDALGYSFDGAKLGLGINSAMKELPQYNIPADWEQYKNKAKYFSEQGLLPEEKAQAIDMANMDYAADVRNVENASGGNAGAVLANLGNIGMGRYRLANDLALKDRMLKQSNFNNYLPVLNQDIAYKKDVFDRKYNQELANKTEGAGLASDALANIQGRMDFNKFYGEGSYYDKLQKAMAEKGMSEADISKAMAEHYKNPQSWATSLSYANNPYLQTTAAKTTPSGETVTTTDYELPQDYKDAVTKTVGSLGKKDLSKTEWFNIINQLREDGQGNKRTTSDIYDELGKAGFLPPKDIH